MNKLTTAIFLSLLLVSCVKPNPDVAMLESINETYVKAWLANDKEGVLGLFEPDASLAPSGMKPLKGMEQITGFWFPNDSSITTIHQFTSEILDTGIDGNIGHTTQKTFLSWSYQKGDFTMAKDQRGLAMTIYRKQGDGSWKIMHQMWKDVEVIDK
jgi:uncharacterized protein (TIGR02246 family)